MRLWDVALLCWVALSVGCGGRTRPLWAPAPDGGPPGGDADAGVDAGPDPDDGWVPLDGLPDDCQVLRALDPASVYEAQWEACPDVRGCRRLTEHPADFAPIRTFSYFDGTQGYVWMTGGGRFEDQVLTPLDGPAVAAFRVRGTAELCYISARAAGDGRVAFTVSVGRDEPGHDEVWLFRAPLGELAGAIEPVHVFDGVLGNNAGLAVSDGQVAVALQDHVEVVRDDGSVVIMEPLDGEDLSATVNVETLVAHQGQVFWSESSASLRIASWRPDAVTALFLDTDGNIQSFGTDGSFFAWIEAFGRVRIELWSAPFATSPEALVPTRVASLSAPPPVLVSGGYAVRVEPIGAFKGRGVLHELATGRRRERQFPEQYSLSPHLVTPIEVLFYGGVGGRDETLARVDLAQIPYVAD